MKEMRKMKLSDVKGDRVFDVIADIIDPISAISLDEEASEIFIRKDPPKGVDQKKFTTNRLRKAIPRLLKHHKKEVITILSVIEGVTAEEYCKSLDMIKLFNDAVDLIQDKDFLMLFTSAEQKKSSSGSATESTEAVEE